jgi:hypothetical protein
MPPNRAVLYRGLMKYRHRAPGRFRFWLLLLRKIDYGSCKYDFGAYLCDFFLFVFVRFV